MKSVLVALDASPVALDVLRAATGQCLPGDRLTLLRVVGLPVEMPLETWRGSADRVVEMLVNAAHEDLGVMARTVPAGITVTARVEIGTPARTICEVARDADLVVMGAHGHRFMDRLLGTTAGRVIAHLDRTVLVVRTPAMDGDDVP